MRGERAGHGFARIDTDNPGRTAERCVESLAILLIAEGAYATTLLMTEASQYFHTLTEFAVGDERPELVAARKKVVVTSQK